MTNRIDTFLGRTVEAQGTLDNPLFKHKFSRQSCCNFVSYIINNGSFSQVANYGIAGQYDTHYDATMMGKDAAADLQRRTVFNHYAGDRMITVSRVTEDPVFSKSIIYKMNFDTFLFI